MPEWKRKQKGTVKGEILSRAGGSFVHVGGLVAAGRNAFV